jgi:hypothetical protein
LTCAFADVWASRLTRNQDVNPVFHTILNSVYERNAYIYNQG